MREGRLTDLELASRLSFFLWSQGPDDALLKVAAAGRLGDPAVLRAQALRMLQDPRAASLVRNFALKSFDLDTLSEAQPDPNLFPTFSELLRQDMATEAESFLSSVLLEDRSSAICSPPTTRSSTSGWRGTTASRPSSARSSAA